MMVSTQLLPSLGACFVRLHHLCWFEFLQAPQVPTNWLVIIFGVVLYIVLAVLSILIWAFLIRPIFKRGKPKSTAAPVRQGIPADGNAPGAPTAEEPSPVEPAAGRSSTGEIDKEAPFGLQLVLETGDVRTYTDLPILIGRSEENDLVLDDDTISTNHARIIFDDLTKAICILDLGSLNGLFVNDQPTCKNILRDGARIRLGSVPMVFRDTGYIPPDNA